MKKPSLLFAAIVMFMVSLSAVAAKAENVRLYDATTVGSATLQPGTYNVAWTGTGPDVKVTFTQNKKVVAEAPATLAVKKNAEPQVNLSKSATGKTLDSVDLKNATLTFTPASTSASAGSAH